jgi:class 3 adenylate cyclase
LTVCGSDLKPECFYDVWGDTVTVARRLETSAEPNLIHVSEDFANAMRDKVPA